MICLSCVLPIRLPDARPGPQRTEHSTEASPTYGADSLQSHNVVRPHCPLASAFARSAAPASPIWLPDARPPGPQRTEPSTEASPTYGADSLLRFNVVRPHCPLASAFARSAAPASPIWFPDAQTPGPQRTEHSTEGIAKIRGGLTAKIQRLVGAFQHTLVESARVGLGHDTPRPGPPPP